MAQGIDRAAKPAAHEAATVAVTSYTGCLSPILNAVYDVAAGESPAHPPCRPPASTIHLSSGDLTSLTAGTGLSGGGDNGDLSLALAPSYRLPQTCAPGQTAGWNGSGWACAADNVGPSYAAGFGLTLLGTTFSVDTGLIQHRITGTCLAGSSIGEIAQDGTVTCRGHAAYFAGTGLALSGSVFSLADGGVTTGKLHDGAVETAKIAPSAVTEGKLSFDPATQAELDAGLGSLNASNLSSGTVPTGRLSGTYGVDISGNAASATNASQLGGQSASYYQDAGNLSSGTVPSGRIGGTYSDAVSFTNAINSFTGSFTGDGSGLTGVTASIATGTGLTGSGAGGDPLQVAGTYRMPQSCLSGQIPKWSGTVWACGPDNEGSGGGSTGHSPAANDLSTLDSAGSVGGYTSVTVGADGLGLISYSDGTNGDLKVAHCANAACTSATTSTLDSALGNGFGRQTSIAVGADGLGLISYYDSTNADLKVAHCADAACTSATTSTLDSAGFVGTQASLTVGADGLGLISYSDGTNSDLKVAHCADAGCTTSTNSTLDSPGTVGWYTSVTVGADGLGLISYEDASYPNEHLKVAHCANAACTSATSSTIAGTGQAFDTSITVGADGLGLVSYHDNPTGQLRVAHCGDAACTHATIVTVDSVNNSVGWATSVTVGTDGLGLVSSNDLNNGDLRVAHLSNAFGTPYFRRR